MAFVLRRLQLSFESIVIRCWAWTVNQTAGELMLSNSGWRAASAADDLCVRDDCFARIGFRRAG